jgi:oxygen-independent coproporphyrinogen-3 oxidase
LLARFRSSVKGEWTVEANPETIDVEFLSLCSDAGVSRLSVGIQSRTDAHLRLLGRAARAKDIARSITFLEKAWRGDVNLDFITGIPNQVIEDVRDDLSLLDAVGAHHVSLYSLTIEKGTELERLIRCRSVRPNSSDVDELLWFEGLAELERRGFRQYEVSNFSLHGRECQHNLRYWRLDPYLGVGPGAVSTLPSDIVALALDRPDLKDRGVLRLHSPRSITGFISGADRLWGATIEEVDPRSFLLENLMMGLRLEEGIPAPRFFHRFGREFSEFFPGLWERWTTEGLAHRPDGRLRLTLRGRLLLDGLMRKIARRLHSAGFPPIDLRWP